MPGTTPQYLLPYPTSSDLAKNGASAIQTLAQAVEDVLDGSSAKAMIRFDTDSTSTSQTTSNTAWELKTDCRVLNFTLGPSGKFAVLLWAAGSHPTAGTGIQARVNLTGAIATSTREITLRNTANISGTAFGVFTGTANATVTATLEMQVTAAGATGTIANAQIWVVALG